MEQQKLDKKVKKPERKIAPTARNENNRQKILDATSKIICQNGISRTSLRSICNEAGISTGTLYYHYRTKDLLLADLLKSMSSGYQSIADLVVARKVTPGEAEEKLMTIMKLRITGTKNAMVYMHMLNETLSGNKTISTTVEEQNDSWIDALEIVLAYIKGQQPSTRTRALAIAIESMSQGLIFQYALNQDYDGRDALLDTIINEVRTMIHTI